MSSSEVRALRAAARAQAARKVAESMLRGRLKVRRERDGSVLAMATAVGGKFRRVNFGEFLRLAEDHEFNSLRKGK